MWTPRVSVACWTSPCLQFADNRLLYLAYAYRGDGRGRPARDDDRMLRVIPVP
jgi:hypothetical protein